MQIKMSASVASIGTGEGRGGAVAAAHLSKRVKFKDRPDWIRGKYWVFTFLYSLFYLIGAAIGFERSKNYFCLGFSGGFGLFLLVLATAHTIDFYRGVAIESLYVAVPFTLSLFCAVIMTCIWALGTTFHSAKIVAIGAWIATIFYFYATIKDYGDGSKYRENNFQYQGLPQEDQPPSMRVRKTVGLTRATKNPLF